MTSSSGASVVDRALELARTNAAELLVVVGPTASGKSALALALAEQLGGEIVGADSVQVYERFDIGSGKPSPADRARVPHHLVGVVSPLESIDAAAWAARAFAIIDEIRRRGRVPIVCGGTFLWVKALLFGLVEIPAASAELRSEHRAVAQREGRPALHARLAAQDPEIAGRLHPNDFVRVSRALEVLEITGKPMSAWQREHGFNQARCQARLIAPRCEEPAHTEIIRARVEAWLAAGWVAEVEALVADGLDAARAMKSVGYAEVRAMLAGTLPAEQLSQAIVRATRIFARRQRTWLKHADVTWL
jgi:tRNA dimethylallyltransferase